MYPYVCTICDFSMNVYNDQAFSSVHDLILRTQTWRAIKVFSSSTKPSSQAELRTAGKQFYFVAIRDGRAYMACLRAFAFKGLVA